jgi:hypothetical protein
VRRIGDDLCIRVFPDQPFVNTHQQTISKEEHDAGKPLFDLVSVDGWKDEPETVEKARGEWKELARRYGPNRAAWIIRFLQEQSTANRAITDEEVQPVPTLFLLPERFVFLVYRKDQSTGAARLAYEEAGKDVTGTLTLLPAEEESAGEGLFDAASQWVSNFDSAVQAGLGIRIRLRGEDRTDPNPKFAQVVAVGLKSSDGNSGNEAFKQFVESHHYTEGFEFLRYGTPTNNSAGGPSGHSASEEEALTSFDLEILSPLSGDRDNSQTVSAQLSHALGIEGSEVFRNIKGADLTADQSFPEFVKAVWLSTGDYFFSWMLGYAKWYTGRGMLLQHAAKYLRPRGPLAAIRVGNIPYGILPVSRIFAKSDLDSTGWKPEGIDNREDLPDYNWTAFNEAVHKALSALLPYWLERAHDSSLVPRADDSKDPDWDMLKLLGMSPHSLTYRVRPIVDQRLILLLLQLFGPYYFGMHSSFWGLADQPIAIATWESERDKITQATWQLLQAMGVGQQGQILACFAWGVGTVLNMPLVRDLDFRPDHPPENYLFHLGEKKASAEKDYSNAFLYELIRRSFVLFPELPGLQQAVDNIGKMRLQFWNTFLTAAKLRELALRDPKLDPLPSYEDLRLLAHTLNGGQPYDSLGTVMSLLPAEMFENVMPKLDEDFTHTLENYLRDVLDSLTCRLDAWYTTLAWQRLDRMREEGANARTERGLLWGAYGYLEDITLAPGMETTGFMHTPSVAHASAAAILRSAYDSHRYDEGGNAYALNLTSSRVNRARTLVDGVQQGQDLPALLGYQFERSLHDAGLDRLIDDFRAAFPITAPEEEDTEATAESIAARNVCDGLKLASAYVDDDPKVNAVLSRLDAADREVVRGLLADLSDANDAVGDLLLYEGIFQAVQGNPDRASAAFDACAGIGKPPDIESVTTPGSGINLRHRVCLLLPSIDGETEGNSTDQDVNSWRAFVEPRLNAWVGSIFGSLSSIICHVYGGQDPNPQPLTLDALGISPLDFLYMCETLPHGEGNTEIESRIRRYVRDAAGNPDLEVRVDFGGADSEFSVANAMELGRAILNMLGNAAILTPQGLSHPDEAPMAPSVAAQDQPSVADFYANVEGLIERIGTAIDKLTEQKTALGSGDPATVLSALEACAQFGIQESHVSSDSDPTILERGSRVLQVVTRKIEAANDILISSATANAQARIEAASEATKILFGDSFVLLPKIDLSSMQTGKVANFQSDTVLAPPPEDRVWLWLQQVAETHPRVRHLETALMLTSAWGSMEGNDQLFGLKIAQLFAEEGASSDVTSTAPLHGWQALSNKELETDERPRGALSIVAMVPRQVDLADVAGFVIDEWTETMPGAHAVTGISFEYNQPASQAPHCFLLAAPGNFEADNGVWTARHLAEIVRDTVTLAKARLVDLDALPEVAGVFPALFFPVAGKPRQDAPGTTSDVTQAEQTVAVA